MRDAILLELHMRMESTCCGVLKMVAVVAFGLGLAGCESGPEMYRGKVIAGTSSLVMHADAGDARLKEKGVEGAKVELRLKDRAGEKIVGTATSDVNGDFTLPPVAPRAVTQQLRLSATKEGMLPARADVYAPGVDRVLLVILKSVSGEAEGVRAPVEKSSNKPEGR
jgi:hypothetical protein